MDSANNPHVCPAFPSNCSSKSESVTLLPVTVSLWDIRAGIELRLLEVQNESCETWLSDCLETAETRICHLSSDGGVDDPDPAKWASEFPSSIAASSGSSWSSVPGCRSVVTVALPLPEEFWSRVSLPGPVRLLPPHRSRQSGCDFVAPHLDNLKKLPQTPSVSRNFPKSLS